MNRFLVVGVYLLLTAASAGVVSAASSDERDCVAAGGMYTFSKGDATCTFQGQAR
jgi:hypothetical protein